MKTIPCKSWRIQSIEINVNNEKYLIFNSYFPNDSRLNDDECEELNECLAQISSIIETHVCNHYFLLGDLNAEFLRNSSHVNSVKMFLARHNMFSVWEDYPVDFTYSFETENGTTHVKTLDHIATLGRSRGNITDAGVIHHFENLSDHEPIYLTYRSNIQSKDKEKVKLSQPKSKPCWRAASDDQKLEYDDIIFRNYSKNQTQSQQ